jgi:diguanylate cyclase
MSQSASEAGDQANQFGSALEQWSEDMGNSQPQSGSIEGMDQLLADTRQMHGAIISLNQQLDDSQRKIAQLQQEVDRARADALADVLTGLTNRKGFDLALAACLASSEIEQKNPSLLIVDIDNFKRVNDTHGHMFGDKVLRAVAQILKQNVKGKDTAARFGGEEFVILLPETSIEGARTVAENIRSTIERSRIRLNENKQELTQITVSLGVARYCSGESASDFIERVDSALYQSKHRGRNQVTLSAKPMQTAR